MLVRGKETESVIFSCPKATNYFLPLIGDMKWRTAMVGTIGIPVGHMEEINKLKPAHKGGVQLRLEQECEHPLIPTPSLFSEAGDSGAPERTIQTSSVTLPLLATK